MVCWYSVELRNKDFTTAQKQGQSTLAWPPSTIHVKVVTQRRRRRRRLEGGWTVSINGLRVSLRLSLRVPVMCVPLMHNAGLTCESNSLGKSLVESSWLIRICRSVSHPSVAEFECASLFLRKCVMTTASTEPARKIHILIFSFMLNGLLRFICLRVWCLRISWENGLRWLNGGKCVGEAKLDYVLKRMKFR